MEKIAENYINRFKAVISNTNKIGILFAFSLGYVWLNSVFPNFQAIQSVLNSYNQVRYFDTVYDNLSQKKQHRIADIHSKRRKLATAIVDNYEKSNKISGTAILLSRATFLEDSSFQNTIVKRTTTLDGSLANLLKSKKAIAQHLNDSIRNAKFDIDIPTLSKVQVTLNTGLPIWMFLSTLLLLIIYLSRNTAFTYLRKGLVLYTSGKIPPENIDHLDTTIPFWLCPFRVEMPPYEGRKIDHAINYNNKVFKTALLALVLLFVLFVQYLTVSLMWNVHKYPQFESSIISRVLCFLLWGSSVLICFLWLIPHRLQIPVPVKDSEPSAGRRRFVYSSALGVIAVLLQINPLSASLYKINGVVFNGRRKKRVNNEKGFNAEHYAGFYINKRRDKIVLHYFDRYGGSLSFKTVPIDTREQFLKGLEKTDLLSQVPLINNRSIHFPFSTWAIEDYSNWLFDQRKYQEGFELLKTVIIANFTAGDNVRLRGIFKKKLQLHKTSLSKSEYIKLERLLKQLNTKYNRAEKYLITNLHALEHMKK